MKKTFPVPQGYATHERPQIELHPVKSSQVKAIGVYFGQHIKILPFNKFQADPVAA
jgi:hypothetical protein